MIPWSSSLRRVFSTATKWQRATAQYLEDGVIARRTLQVRTMAYSLKTEQ